MKLLKILGIVVAALFALLAIAIVALVWLVNPNDYKPQLQQLAAKQGIQLTIVGDLGWSFFPRLGIHAGKFTLKPALKNVREPFQFDDLAIAVKLEPLLHRQLVVDRILIHGKELALQDDDNGNRVLIHQLLIDASDFNLEQRAFPVHISAVIQMASKQSIALSIDTKLSLEKMLQHVHLDAVAMQVDDTQLKGSVDVTLGQIPFLVVDLAGTQVDLDHYFPATEEPAAVGKTERDHPALHTKTQSKPDEIIPVSSINALPGDYHLSLQQLTWQHLHGNNLQLALTISRDGLLTLKQLDLQGYDGDFSVSGSLDARPSLPELALDVTLNRLSLAPALHDFLQTDAPPVSGDMALEAKVTTHGAMQDQLLQNMNGTFTFHSDTLMLNGVDLTHSLNAELFQQLQTYAPTLMAAGNKTTLSHLVGKGELQQGKVNNTALTATGLCSQFHGNGTYDLLNHAVLYHLAMTFPSTGQDRACSEINVRLKDKDWPFLCQGSLDSGAAKICGADKDGMNAIARDILRDEAKKALVKKFGDKIDSLKNTFRNLFH
jgi:AsmA protein